MNHIYNLYIKVAIITIIINELVESLNIAQKSTFHQMIICRKTEKVKEIITNEKTTTSKYYFAKRLNEIIIKPSKVQKKSLQKIKRNTKFSNFPFEEGIKVRIEESPLRDFLSQRKK